MSIPPKCSMMPGAGVGYTSQGETAARQITGKVEEMSDNDIQSDTVILRIHRFTPRSEQERETSGGPFSRRRSPFASSASPSRRRPRGKHWIQEYSVHAHPQDTILDCLMEVKRRLDPTLAFRYSCGHGMCGSDAVMVNGIPTLLCTATVGRWVQSPDSRTPDGSGALPGEFRPTADLGASPSTGMHRAEAKQAAGPSQGVIEVSPLQGFTVQRDLIADLDPMMDQIRKLGPYLHTNGGSTTADEDAAHPREHLQSPGQLQRYELLSNCISCGLCEASCPVFAGGEAFIGPAALISAARFINDSRDTATEERLDAIDSEDGVAACQSVRACSRPCPRGIDVGEEIWQLISQVNERRQQRL